MRGITARPCAAYGALALLSACATMKLGGPFDAADVARKWQATWDREAWDAPREAVVTGVTDLSCAKASEFQHALWCGFHLHYASAGTTHMIPMERWLVDRDVLAPMKRLRP